MKDTALLEAIANVETEMSDALAKSSSLFEPDSAVLPDSGEQQRRLKFSVAKTRFATAPSYSHSLWLADMDCVPPSSLAASVSSFMAGHFGYQDIDIRRDITDYLKRDGTIIKPEYIVDIASVVAGIALALRTFCETGDKVMVVSPTYGPLYSAVTQNKMTPVSLFLSAECSDIDDLDRFDTEARALVLCHPNNPTGSILSPKAQAALLARCKRHNILVISDEVHREFHFDQYDNRLPPVPLFGYGVGDCAHSNVISFCSTSKAFNLAAIGGASYAIIANPSLRTRFIAAVDNEHLEAAPISKIALQEAYRSHRCWQHEIVDCIGTNRAYAKRLLGLMKKENTISLDSASYFLWLDLRQLFSGDILEACCRRGVIVGNGAHCHAPGFVRLSIACHPTVIKSALLRLFY
ncbi:aminotransferase class I/II-fold pyridoxal phosphate-dependent enzyme [Alteromonas sp. A079]|uniref:aminotransferase class I/II-fold pyridoxal phosphate-dependent enzyme n=1 Tax=Alteromonas sp. A079 TaxID=3410268 RepID=UPI003BA00F4C